MGNNVIFRLLNKFFVLVFYRNDLQLLAAPGKKDRNFFILQAVFGTATISLFLGVFLSGLYIYMGAPDEVMGYIPIMPNIAGILMIFTAGITERVKNVKRMVVILNFISKGLLFCAVWIPAFIPWGTALYIMLPLTFLGFVFNTIMSILINSWFVDTIDIGIRGRYMGTRQSFSLLISATLPVIAGRFLDGFHDRYLAFCIIYSAAFLFSFMESFSLSKVTSPPVHEHKSKKIKLKDIFITPLKNKAFMKFMAIMLLFHLAWFLSMTFAQVYEIRYMKISYTYLTLMGSIGAIIQVLIYPLWGKITDKYGSNIVMRIAIFMFMVHTVLYFFMVRSNAHILLVFLNINGAILTPAWILSTFNERFSTIPTEGRTIYDSFFTAFNGAVILLAPTIGNILRRVISSYDISIIPYAEFKILFLISFVSLLALNTTLLLKSKRKTSLETEKRMLREAKAKLKA